MGLFHMSTGDLRAYYLGFLVCIGGLLFGYDTGVVGACPHYRFDISND